MVWMPPGSAKSTYASILFPAWYLGRNPRNKIIAASYAAELAEKFGRRVRSIVSEPDWQDIFANRLSSISQAAGRWELESGGEYYAAGAGGGIAGFRADLAVIDDPIKGREAADSETARAKIKEWYTGDLWPRLKPGAAIVIIQTRWHEDDLCGWLKEEEAKGGEKWEVLSLPAIAEEGDALGRTPGEPLWPEWFTPEMFSQAQRDARNWSALYQQRPAPEDGDYFKREWIRWYDPQTRPKHLRMYGASDYAVTDQGGDYTVHLVAGVDPNDDIYVLELWRDQTESLTWVEILIELIQVFKPMEWGEESGQIAKGIGPLIDKRQRETKAFCFRKQFPSSSDKQQRAQAIRGRMAQGKVYFPKHKTWVDSLITEMLQFPAGKHDDQVDALSLLGRMLAEMIRADEPKPIKAWEPPKQPTIDQLLQNHIRNRQRERDSD